MSERNTLTIGKLAMLGGVNVQTIRFYERSGLLPKPPRTSSGYRQYGPMPYAGCDSSNKPKCLDFLLLKLMNCFHFGGNQGRRAQMCCDELAKRLLPSTIRLKAFGELSLL
jgi:hypothetical protein